MKLSSKHRWIADLLDQFGEDAINLALPNKHYESGYERTWSIGEATHYYILGSSMKEIPETVDCPNCEGEGNYTYTHMTHSWLKPCCTCNSTGIKYD